MPRIYKPVRPSANKAIAPVKETKNSENKQSEIQKSDDKKNGEQ